MLTSGVWNNRDCEMANEYCLDPHIPKDSILNTYFALLQRLSQHRNLQLGNYLPLKNLQLRNLQLGNYLPLKNLQLRNLQLGNYLTLWNLHLQQVMNSCGLFIQFKQFLFQSCDGKHEYYNYFLHLHVDDPSNASTLNHGVLHVCWLYGWQSCFVVL